ncbi:MAG: molybdate ABC transporter permease subunit [Nitrospirota bacterium]
MEDSVFFSLRLSLQVASIATFFVVIAGISIAYLLSRGDFIGKDMIDIVLTLPLVLPPTVTGYYLVIIFGRKGLIGSLLYEWTGLGIMFTWQAAVLASFVVSLPLMIKTARAAMESVDKNLINASYTLGHSRLETAVRVIMPLSARGIIAGAVLSFARAMGEFGATLMIAGNIPGKTDTMPLAIYSLASSGEWTGANMMVLLLTIFSGFFLYAANRLGRKVF